VRGRSEGEQDDVPPDSWRRAGVAERALRELRRGRCRIEGEIDLHGLTVAQAKDALREFLREALAAQQRCVRVIHGKGLRSGPGGPVLKATAGAALREHPAVLAFAPADPAGGGSGATHVLLASPSRGRQ
jgi:DNA-nicking Smr family endonuclease